MEELAVSLGPAARLDGFDVSSDQFKSGLSKNVQLHVVDAKGAFPTEFHSQFDVVHLRLLVTAMDKEDWELVTRNVMQLLKPGGVIQWDEARFCDVVIVRNHVDSTTFWLDHTEKDFMKRYKHRLDYGWSTLPSVFEQVGLRDLQTDIVSSDRVSETRTGMTQVLSEGVFEWARAMAAKGSPVWPADQTKDIEKKTKQDIESGAYTRFDIHIAIGRRKAS